MLLIWISIKFYGLLYFGPKLKGLGISTNERMCHSVVLLKVFFSKRLE